MAAKKHDFTKQEIAAGLLVVVTLAILGMFIAAVRHWRPEEDTATYYVRFVDTGGLRNGADVRFGGLQIGRVTSISPDPDDQSLILVAATVDPKAPINAASKGSIGQTTLTAEKHLEIGTGDPNAERLPDGSRLPSVQGGLFDSAEELATTVTEVMGDVRALLGVQAAKDQDSEKELASLVTIFAGVDDILQDGNMLVGDAQGIVQNSGKQVEQILDELHAIEKKLQAMLDENRGDIRTTIGNTRALSTNANELVVQISDQEARIAERIEASAATLENLLAHANLATGETKDLLHEMRPFIEEIIFELNETARNARIFSETIAEQPQALIRGKNEEGRKVQ